MKVDRLTMDGLQTLMPRTTPTMLAMADGAPPPSVGEGLETSIAHSWPWPPWLTVVVFLLLAMLIVGIYLRERGAAGRGLRLVLIGLRLLVISLVLVMLYGWTRQRHRTDLPEIVVVVDDSGSMTTIDADDAAIDGALRTQLASSSSTDATRFNRARAFLLDHDGQLLRSLRQRYRVRWYWLGDSARAIADNDHPDDLPAIFRDAEPRELSSRLGQGLMDILQQQRARPTAAIVLLTDGITTDGPSLAEAAQLARRRQVPLYCIGVGSPRAPVDTGLHDLVVDDVAFVNDLLHFDARLATAGCAGRTLVVRLRRTDNDSILSEQRVAVQKEGETLSIRLSTRPREKGRFEYAISVDPLPGEANKSNNRLTRAVTVTEETLRVLMIQARPSYEFRYLKTLLARQLKSGGEGGKAVELTTILQEADPDHAMQDETAQRVFPVTREELFRYDVVIFGDANPSLLGAAALTHLVEFVTTRGGGLVVTSGPWFTPLAYRDTALAGLLPVTLETAAAPAEEKLSLEPFHPRLTTLGKATPPLQLADAPDRNDEVWRSLAPWYWTIDAPDLRSGARVLAEHPTRTDAAGRPLPLISLQFVGAGKVVFHSSDESWRWSRGDAGDIYYVRYWMQLLRYLGRSKLLQGDRPAAITTDREEYQRGDVIRLRARFFDERSAPADESGVTVVVQRDGGGQRSIQLRRDSSQRGRFEGTLTNLGEGSYRAWMASPATTGEPSTTSFTVLAPPAELARLAMDTPALQAAATISEGQFQPLSEVTGSSLVNQLPAGRPVRIESLPPEPIWNAWPLAALFVALVTAEWLLRRRAGMI